jgi:hypothetical protein
VTHAPVLMPSGVAALPRDRHHRPIPWFVHVEPDGTPDFRVIRRGGIPDALRFNLCWVCGRTRGRHAAFVIGPMCAVNRTSAEPPAHLECATYSALACPFLSTPGMVRRERGMHPEHRSPAGVAILRNPGVALVWSSRTWTTFRDPDGGLLFDIGDPTATAWYAEGRPAIRAEVLHSIDTGLPLLRAEAERQRGGVEELSRMTDRALQLLPA